MRAKEIMNLTPNSLVFHKINYPYITESLMKHNEMNIQFASYSLNQSFQHLVLFS